MCKLTKTHTGLTLRDIEVRAHIARSEAAFEMMRALRQILWNTFRRPIRRFS